MEGVEVVVSHLSWVAGIVITGGVAGAIASWRGANKKDAQAAMYLTSTALLLIYLFIAFR